MRDIFGREPAVILGIIAAAVLAAVRSLGGDGVIGPDLADSIERALNPTDGWAIPIILGIVTRFFVYAPKTVKEVAATAAATGSPVVTTTPP
jgi:hypothetical protein